MFAKLSEKQVVNILTKSSETETALIIDNIKKLNDLLNSDVNELLANRKKTGSLLLIQSNASKAVTPIKKEVTLVEALSDGALLISEVNKLCLTEAIIVRDSLINAIDIYNEVNNIPLNVSQEPLKKVESVSLEPVQKSIITADTLNTSHTLNTNTNNINNNVLPIHLVEVKQRLSKALQTDNEKRSDIKKKLNALLEKNVDEQLVSNSKSSAKITAIDLQA
jgi:uncharacterized membrane-anchored protein YjiN (DUF445 family)